MPRTCAGTNRNQLNKTKKHSSRERNGDHAGVDFLAARAGLRRACDDRSICLAAGGGAGAWHNGGSRWPLCPIFRSQEPSSSCMLHYSRPSAVRLSASPHGTTSRRRLAYQDRRFGLLVYLWRQGKLVGSRLSQSPRAGARPATVPTRARGRF